MSEQYPPPPGWNASNQAPTTQPYGVASPPPMASMGAAHKPGAIALRPLSIGDMYDAAFKIIRFNPRATVGSAVLVAAVAMAIPLIVTAALGAGLDLSMTNDLIGTSEGEVGASVTGEDIAGLAGVFGSLALGSILQGIGLILVGGMIAHVVAAAAIGQKLTLGEAWAATRGKRWRLIGLTFLLGLATTLLLVLYTLSWVAVALAANGWQLPVFYGLISVPVFIAFFLWFWIRVYYLPVPALMLEPNGVFGALGRGFQLTRRSFWRTFGIGLLTFIIAQVGGAMLSTPVSLLSQGVLLGGVSGETGVYLLVLGQAVASVITAAFVAPFTTSVATLQYIDLRMRKEAFDVVLMERAGLTSGGGNTRS